MPNVIDKREICSLEIIFKRSKSFEVSRKTTQKGEAISPNVYMHSSANKRK